MEEGNSGKRRGIGAKPEVQKFFPLLKETKEEREERKEKGIEKKSGMKRGKEKRTKDKGRGKAKKGKIER